MIDAAQFNTLKTNVDALKSASDQHGADLSYLQQFQDDFNGNVKAKLDPVTEALRAEIQALRDELTPKVDTAQATADSAMSKADAAQATANSAVKGIKFFTAEAAIDTTHAEVDVMVDFPERVDAVAIESIVNDGHDMWRGIIERVGDRSFKVMFVGSRGEGNRWVPALRFLGIQVQR